METAHHVQVKDVVAAVGLGQDPLYQDFSVSLEECKKLMSEVSSLKRDFD